jgi:Tetratricopeptide repeat
MKEDFSLGTTVKLLVMLAFFVGVDAGIARAAPEDPTANRNEAKRLRDLGAAAMEQGKFADAVEAFQQAYEIYPTPNLRYNLAWALAEVGRFAEAVDAFEEFLATAPAADPGARERATARLRELESRIARLEVVVAPADAVISIDGQPPRLPRMAGIPVMPGARRVVAERLGYARRSERVTLAAGEHRRIEWMLALSATPAPAQSPAIAATARTDRKGAPVYKKWWLWTAVGVVAAGAAVGLGVGLTARSGSSTSIPDLGPGAHTSSLMLHF